MKIWKVVIFFAIVSLGLQVNAQTYRVGDLIQNSDGSYGVVFYVNPDRTGGWMVALQDASNGCPWGTSSDIPALNNFNPGDYFYQILLTDLDGMANTQKIRNYQNNSASYAAGKVNFNNGWYLPSAGQLQHLYSSLTFIEPSITNAGGTTMSQTYYWSSSERTGANAWVVCFGIDGNNISGCFYSFPKTENHSVRAVRDFTMSSPYVGDLTYLWNTGATTADISVSPTQTTTYSVTVFSGENCGSEASKTILVNQGDTTYLNVTSCESYPWYGTTYSQSGVYEHLLVNTAGCDSLLILDLTIGNAFNSEMSIDACDSYDWRGTTYRESGTYTETVPNPSGCDSTFVLHLTVNYSDTTYLTVETCEDYPWYGTVYTQSGIYQQLLQTTSGCDSLLVLDLTVGHSFNLEETVEICDEYLWHGNTYYESGIYTDQIPSPIGCDSTFVLNLTVHYSDTVDLQPVFACDIYEWHGQNYSQSGILTYQTTNEHGCNRLERLDLTINRSAEYEFNVTSCEPYPWYGEVYDEPGEYHHLMSTVDGCDSLLIMHLDIGDVFMMEETVASCGEYKWRGRILTETGDYQDEALNPDGCDSVFSLHLTINNEVYHEFSQHSCGVFSWNGVPYGVSGDYQQTFVSATNCDSIVTMHLDIQESFYVEIDTLSCGPFPWQGEMLTESGDYQALLQSVAGCDSLVVLHLSSGAGVETAIEGTTSVYPATNLISGVYSYHVDSTMINPSSVHWEIDRDDWPIRPHGARCDLICTSEGYGRLRAWTMGESCNLDTSLVIHARFFGVGEEAYNARIYPNPTKGTLTVETVGMEHIRLSNIMGQVIATWEFDHADSAVLNLNGYESSIYIIEIKTVNGMIRKRIVIMK